VEFNLRLVVEFNLRLVFGMGGAGGWTGWAAAHPEFGPSDLDFF
jgi:hypothetical protein